MTTARAGSKLQSDIVPIANWSGTLRNILNVKICLVLFPGLDA